MSIWKWLNPKRLRDYPRLILISCGSVIFLNVLLRHAWIGGLTGILLWGDFICYYAAAILYRTDIAQLYNSTVQQNLQFRLIAPTIPPGVTLYTYPPNAALLNSLISYVPLLPGLILWCLLSIGCIILAAHLMHRYMTPDKMSKKGLTSFQLSIIIFSSFAFIEGFNAGQVHSITLLLIVAVLLATIKEKWLFAGFFAAVLTYKPQFVIGFLIVWFVWKKYYAILVFVLISLIWNGFILITKGINPYLDFTVFLNYMVYLPYIKEGIPHAILSSPYTFIASFLPFKYASIWNLIYYGLALVLAALFAYIAYKGRKIPVTKQSTILSMAVLLPLLITPYSLLHDLLLLFPVMILLIQDHEEDRKLLLYAIIIYLAMLVFPLISYATKIAFTGLIPIIAFVLIIQRAVLMLRSPSMVPLIASTGLPSDKKK